MSKEKTGGAAKILKRMPSAFTILVALIAVMAVLTWFIPAGRYQLNDEGEPIAGTYQTAAEAVEETTAEVERIQSETGIEDLESDEALENEELQAALEAQSEAEGLTNKQGLWDVILAPIKGFIDEDGVQIIVFILVIGGFLTVESKTKSIQTAFARIIRKLKGREKWIIPIMMLVFAAGGTTYGMQEETVAFYPLIVPLLMAAGYNAMTAVLVIVGGSTIGLIGGTVNPFATGIASGFAGISIGDGVIPRIILLVLSYIVGVVFVMRYAAKVKAGKYAEDSVNDHKLQYGKIDVTGDDKMTKSQIATTLIYIFAFVILVLGVIPWEWKFDITFFSDITNSIMSVPIIRSVFGNIPAFGDWWFIESAAVFLIGAIVIAFINKVNQHDFIDWFIEGCKDIFSVALIVGVARGISVVMTSANIDATIIHAGEVALQGTAGPVFTVLAYILYLPMSFLIPSTSGLAAATMPILAPITSFVGFGKDVIVTAYTASSGIVQMIAPTVGSLMGGLVICGLSYGKYLKRTWKMILALMATSIAVLIIISLI